MTSLGTLALLEYELDRVLSDLTCCRKDENSPFFPIEQRLTAALQRRWRQVTAGVVDRFKKTILPQTSAGFDKERLRQFLAELPTLDATWGIGLPETAQRWINGAVELGVLLGLRGRTMKVEIPELLTLTLQIADQFEALGTNFYQRFVQAEVQDLVNEFLKNETPSEEEYLALRRQVLAAFDAQGSWRTLANLATSRAVQAGTLEMAQVVGMEYYTWISPGARDGLPNTCPNCTYLHGRTFPVDAGVSRMDQLLATRPDDLKSVAPFPRNDQLLGRSTFELQRAGYLLPPLHPACFSDDTEFLTTHGWVFLRDAKIGDHALSLDPKTLNLEPVPVVRTISKSSTEMVRFWSRNLDIQVTDDHQMFYQTDWNTKKHYDRYTFTPARDLVGKKSGQFYASSKWVGQNEAYLRLGNLNFVPPQLYAAFMGWYLSEGSCVTGRWVIQIAQSKEVNSKKCAEIDHLLDQIGLPHYYTGGNFMIHSRALWEQLRVYGRSYEKFVPKEIKQATPDVIRIFLDSFRSGDGSIRKSRWKKTGVGLGWAFRPEITYSTSSDQLASDLGELIIKVGRRPSYTVRPPGTTHHRNGIFTSKRPQWVVRECYGQTHSFSNVKSEIVPYAGTAVCVELAKFHTLLVRRKGRVVWAGNCRCLLVFASDAEVELATTE